jgi:chromosome segregation ATPase
VGSAFIPENPLVPEAGRVCQENPFFFVEDRVSLGRRSAAGILSDDTYEPWPKDPRTDPEKEGRRQWLRAEIERLRYEIREMESKKGELDREIYSLQNEISSLKTERDRIQWDIRNLNDRWNELDVKKQQLKRRHRETTDPNERYRLTEEIQRCDDELSRTRERISELTWRKRDVDYSIDDKSRQIESHREEIYRLNERLSHERWTLAQREEELRRLGGVA